MQQNLQDKHVTFENGNDTFTDGVTKVSQRGKVFTRRKRAKKSFELLL